MTKDESRRTVAELDRQVGEQLKAWRETQGLTQSDVGVVLGVSYQQVQKYERGIDRMSAGMLLRLAGPDHLLFDDEQRTLFDGSQLTGT